jgi:hypothetical protein
MEMAKEYGITDYPSPGGGCLLTDAGFSRKLKDLMMYNMFDKRSIEFLKTGRHFRLDKNIKLIIGRNKNENNNLSLLAENEIVMQTKEIPGPLGIIQSVNAPTLEEIKLSGSILLRYNSRVENSSVVQYGMNFKLNNEVEIDKMLVKDIKQYQI